MNITIGRYERPTDAQREEIAETAAFPYDSWECYIEPEDRSWILYVGNDGTPVFWPEREVSGAVIGEPISR